MICFAFAVPHEGEDLVAQMTDTDDFSIGNLKCVTGTYKDRYVLVAFLGMGMERSSRHTERVFEYFRIKAFIMSGYGGALVPQLKHGEVVISDNFSTEAVLSFVRLLSGFQFAKFCTSDELVATPERRKEFAAATECQVVDMETAAVAEVVHQRQVPFLAARAISDTYETKLPVAAMNAAFNQATSSPKPLRLATHLLTHPGQIGPFREFTKRLPEARRNLTDFLGSLTDELPKSF